MALGATRSGMLAMVLRRALMLSAVGIAVGLLITPLATRGLTGLLFGIRPSDPLSLVGTAAALVVVASLAALVPSRPRRPDRARIAGQALDSDVCSCGA